MPDPSQTITTRDLSVRPLMLDEVHLVVDYFVNSTASDRERMGLLQVPPREVLTESYRKACTTDPRNASSFYLLWFMRDQAVGFSSLKDIVWGEHGAMHLHMWAAPLRGRGFGAALFCMSALDFYGRFQLRTIVCEPRAKNPMPNAMLSKVGFPLESTFVGASSELSAVTELNRYRIEREIAERYLEKVGVRPTQSNETGLRGN